MIPSKQKVLEVLKDVVYFPKGSNIVDAEMVKDVEVGENLVRFKLVLDDVDDEKNKFVIENAKKILNDNFGDVDVDIIPTGSAYSVTQDADNPRMLVSITPAQNTAVVVDNLAVVAPFNGSSTAASADNGIRQYTKTIAFRIPLRGAGVSKNIVEPLSNGEGYLAVVEKKDNNGADGKYEVIGFQQPLKVNEDGIQRTEDENGGAILATMSCVEGWFVLGGGRQAVHGLLP